MELKQHRIERHLQLLELLIVPYGIEIIYECGEARKIFTKFDCKSFSINKKQRYNSLSDINTEYSLSIFF